MSSIDAISHIAVGVTDMQRSLGFYRDVLGMHVSLDTEEELPGFGGGEAQKRRAVYLRWREGPHETFVVLDQQLSREPFGEPPTLFMLAKHSCAAKTSLMSHTPSIVQLEARPWASTLSACGEFASHG